MGEKRTNQRKKPEMIIFFSFKTGFCEKLNRQTDDKLASIREKLEFFNTIDRLNLKTKQKLEL